MPHFKNIKICINNELIQRSRGEVSEAERIRQNRFVIKNSFKHKLESVGQSRIFGCMCATHDPIPPHRSPEVHPRWIFHSCWLTVCTFISWLIYSKFPFVVLVISVACKRTLAFPSARGDSSYSRHAVFWTKSTIHHYMERSFYSRFICFICLSVWKTHYYSASVGGPRRWSGDHGETQQICVIENTNGMKKYNYSVGVIYKICISWI